MDNQEKIKTLKLELLDLEAKETSQLFSKAKSNIIGGIVIFLIGCFIVVGSLNSEATIPAFLGGGLILWGVIGLMVGASKNAGAEKTKTEVEARILSIKKELLEHE